MDAVVLLNERKKQKLWGIFFQQPKKGSYFKRNSFQRKCNSALLRDFTLS